MTFMDDTFGKWLDKELRSRDLSARKIARRAGISHTAVNNAMSGQANTTLETYTVLARALGISLEEILRRGGKLPPSLADRRLADPQLDEACTLYVRLGRQLRQALLETMRSLAGTQEPGNPGTIMAEERVDYASPTLQQMALQLARDLEAMHAEDARLVLELVGRLRGRRREGGHVAVETNPE